MLLCASITKFQKKNQKNRFALDDEDLEQVEPELEQVQEKPMVTSGYLLLLVYGLGA